MKKINNVIICGLGALGLTYADKLKDFCELKILANNERIQKYKVNPLIFNDKIVNLEYIDPSMSLDADLIIITTKSAGLNFAIESIKNFVSENTIILSLINGISSEERILEKYPDAQILRSYFIGHSAMREGNMVKQDGVGKIVFEPNADLENFFKKSNIDYEVSDDIIFSQWVKLGVNIVLNQLSAIYKCNVGELKKHQKFIYYRDNLLKEVEMIARACGIKNLGNYKKEVINAIDLIADDGKTSMLQDILAGRQTEVDIFSGEIIKLGKKYKLKTPFNIEIYNKIYKI